MTDFDDIDLARLRSERKANEPPTPICVECYTMEMQGGWTVDQMNYAHTWHKGNPTPSTPDNEQEHTAMNIVYQLGDLYELPVELRQRTNDQAIEFVKALLHSSYEAGRRAELEAVKAEMQLPTVAKAVEIGGSRQMVKGKVRSCCLLCGFCPDALDELFADRLAALTQADKEGGGE